MRPTRNLLKTLSMFVVAATFGLMVTSTPVGASSRKAANPAQEEAARTGHHSRDVCAKVAKDEAQCLAKVTDKGASDPTPLVSTSPYAISPAALKAAYGFPTDPNAGAGTTIAVVAAYDQPSVQSDLEVFSQTYGLPCDGCLTKVNQTGGTTYPALNASWALEISLDVQWVHAIAPGAKILLVEATTNSWSNLMAAVDYAKTRASYVTMSWGGPEFANQTGYDSRFSAPGVSFFAASGDSGLGTNYPSSSPNVISVGGTTLNNIGTPSATETAWSLGGGGCSVYEQATAAQRAFSQYAQAGCAPGARATPDVSLNADPATGFSVYNSTPPAAGGNWYRVGGTSASAPVWAARAAVEGGTMNSSRIYGATPPPLRDITSGNNGAPAMAGYDLASGRGSWFNGSSPSPTTTVPSSTTTTAPPTTVPPTTTTTVASSVTTRSFNGNLKHTSAQSYTVVSGAGTMNNSLSFSGSATSLTVTVKASNGAILAQRSGPSVVSQPVPVAAGTYTVVVSQAIRGTTGFTLTVTHPTP